MMCHFNLNKALRGFTLIELLVVIAILSVLVSFVAPYTISGMAANESRGELINFEQFVKKWYLDGFYHGGNITLYLNENTVLASNASRLLEQVSYQHLTFEEQHINVPSVYIPGELSIELRRRETVETLTIVLE